MTSIGTGYDLSATTFSPAGRVFQVEYASKAVENSGTLVALRCRDGVVFASENIVQSKLHNPGCTNRTFGVDRHIAMAFAGLVADGRALVGEARSYASEARSMYGLPINCKKLQEDLAGYMHQFTLYGGARPSGCNVMLGSFDKEHGAQLYMIEPSGVSFAFHACAAGKGAQAATAELEKLTKQLSTMPARTACMHAARIIYSVHDDVKDKEFELEMSWVADETNGLFQQVPKAVYDEAVQAAKAALEDEDEEED